MNSKHLLSILDLDIDDIREIFEVSKDIKQKHKNNIRYKPLDGKTLGMIFQKPSTRTRVSFETGIYQLGGIGLYLNAQDLQLKRGEDIRDTAQTLSRYIDGIMIRTFSHQDVIDLAEYGTVPIINGLTDLCHPCQILGDLLTIMEYNIDIDNMKIVFIGDGNNVANSWINAAAKLGFHLIVSYPGGYEPDKENLKKAQSIMEQTGGKVEFISNPVDAVKDADVIYTDVWASMGQEKEHAERLKVFQPYQLNQTLLSHAKQNAVVMHCLPAHRGEEITDEVMDGSQSIVFDQAENRLHIQKGIMTLLM